MQRLKASFGRAHLGMVLGFYLVFAAFTVFVLSQQSESDRRENWNAAATLGVIAGPFTGTIARGFQSCCWQFSLKLFPGAAAGLVVGGLLQRVPLPLRRWERFAHLTIWGLALLGWFGSAVWSFGHALS